MKKIYLFLGCAALALPVMAENPQLPNGGFEDEWTVCEPYTTDPADPTDPDVDESQIYLGTTPSPWTVANVIGYHSLGATQVGDKAEGYESATAVKLTNTVNSLLDTQTVPGYMALGTTWNTSRMGAENDGGSFGGAEFTGRPEKITFMYKYEREGENTEPASAVAYLWKGKTTQADVPAAIGIFTAPPTVDMVNRDRNILGIATNKGGDVTKSDDFELIAKGEVKITETTSEWVKGEVVFEYYSEATPEMINVIFASYDYFTENVVSGNSLTVDNVECVYPVAEAGTVIEASQLTVPGTCTVDGFTFVTDKAEGASAPILHNNTNTLRLYANNTLTISGKQLNKIVFNLNSTGDKRYAAVTASTGTVSQQAVGDTEFTWTGDATEVTFTVGAKADFGSQSTQAGQVHILSFEIDGEGAAAVVAEPATYNGNLVVDMSGMILSDGAASINITPTGDGKCTFLLPNLVIDMFGMPMVLGDIEVENVEMTTADGVTTYKGAKEGLVLAGGDITADVELEGTEDAKGNLTMTINVNQMDTLIICTFTGVKDSTTGIFGITADENAPVEYYNLKGIRVNENAVAPGLYIRRQGNKANKVIIR